MIKEEARLGSLSAFVNLGISEFNYSLLKKEGVEKLVKKRLQSTFNNLLKSKVVDIKDLSIFHRMNSIKSSLPLAEIWREQILQLIDVDEHGFYKGTEKQELANSKKIISKLLVGINKMKSHEDIGTLPILNNIISVISQYFSLELLKTPLNKAADSLEKIITNIIDYETIVPMKYHWPEKEEMIQLLSRWRKKERRTWRTLLSIQNLDEILNDLDTCILF